VSRDNVVSFSKAINKDAHLNKRISEAAPVVDAWVRVAHDGGFEFTPDEFVSAISEALGRPVTTADAVQEFLRAQHLMEPAELRQNTLNAAVGGSPCADPMLVPAFRQRLADAGFNEEGIRNACSVGMSDPWSLATGQPPRDGSPFSTVFNLFWSGAPVERRLVEAAFDPLRVMDLEKLGVIEVRGSLVHPLCLIRPWDGLFVAGDTPVPQRDRVLGVSPSSETLSRLTVRRPGGRALDLGTGCGVQGLALARHSEIVISVDVNPRALAYAAFNARLNAITNIQFRQGSWFAPIDGERFDTIACNPPYVISPDVSFTYRDGGLPRDGVSRMVVSEAAAHLAEGGFATIMCNWVHGESWADSLRSWLPGSGCDALLLHYATVEAPIYAARWNSELQTRSPQAFESAVRRWIDYYRAEGIGRIGLGAVILRRRSNVSNWARALDMATGPDSPSSDHVLRLFEAADFLESHGADGDLLQYPFKLVDGHRVDQTLAYPAGKYVVGPAIFRCLPGIGLEARVDAQVLEILLECDGRRTLRDLAAETALRRGEPESAIAEMVTAPVRQLVERGFLVPIVNGEGKPGRLGNVE
jgi:methylase of polypeptide subunit release factors